MSANLHHLQLFYYVAKAKGISSAVKIIPYGIQQPAISQQLMQLEEELGTPLFRRRPFELTPSGEKLYKFVAKFFDNLDVEVAHIKDEGGMRIRFGCPSIISANYFPELVGAVIAKFPKIRPYISELDGYAAFHALLNRDVDISLSFGNLTKSKAVIVNEIVSIPYALILPEGHRFLEKGFWPKSDFAGEKWIALQMDSGGAQDLIEGLTPFGISPEFSASTNSIEAALKYVEMGLGITLMAEPPPSMLKSYKVKCLPQQDIFGSAVLSLAWHKDCLIDEDILKFIAKTAKAFTKKYIK